MSTKLTLTVDKTVIEEAKKYAKLNGKSLSKIIEEYLKSLIEVKLEEPAFEISPLVASLWGSVPIQEESINYKELLSEELSKKYLG